MKDQENATAVDPLHGSAVFKKSDVRKKGSVGRAGDKADVKKASKETGK
jgi:hypothetical protein